MAGFPVPTGIETYHTKPYSAIDVTRPELSAAGKVVLITGGGSGLGLAFAEHFAKAGSTKIAITGRREQVLDEAKKKIESAHPDTNVLALQGDIAHLSDVEKALSKIKETFGPIDVLVNNAAYLPEYEPIGSEKESVDDWWLGFETNIKGSHNILRTFVKTSAKDATILNLTSAAANAVIPGQSAYAATKLAGVKLFEIFQAENPNYRVVNIAPGVVLTSMHNKTIAAFDVQGWPQLPLDDIELPASYMVWAASPEATFIKGKFVWVHWDVTELEKVVKSKTEDRGFLTSGIFGVPSLGL